MQTHKDRYLDKTKTHTLIIYLNGDYEAGEDRQNINI
jgi:hypothetical protein